MYFNWNQWSQKIFS